MAVVVFDRQSKPWTFESAVSAGVDPNTGSLLLRDADAAVVGAFNPEAWTHWGRPQDES